MYFIYEYEQHWQKSYLEVFIKPKVLQEANDCHGI